MGFNKRVNSIDKIGKVARTWLKRVIESIDITIDQSGQEGTVFLKNFLDRHANWRGTLVNSIKYNPTGKFVAKIMVTAPHSRFLNEGIRPHVVTRFKPDGSPRLTASGALFGDWLDEHGFKGRDSIWVGANLNSILRKPGLQFIPKTAVHISQRIPRILEFHIKRKLEVI